MREEVEMPDQHAGQRGQAPWLAGPVGRRQFMRLAASVAAAGISGSVLEACGSTSGGVESASQISPTKIGGQLQLLAWQGYEGNGIINAWRQLHHLTVAETPLSNVDDILTHLRAGGQGRYSLATPNVAYVELFTQVGILQPIDYSKIPNARNLIPTVVKIADPAITARGQRYAIPYLLGQDGLIYNASKVSKPTSWFDLLKPEYKGKVVMLGGANEVFEIWPKVLGYDLQHLTKAQLAKVSDFLVKFIKSQCRVVTEDPAQALSILAAGNGYAIASGNSLGYPVLAPKGDKLASTMPKEGGASWVDSWAIPKSAPNIDSAYAFINHMLSTSVQAKVATTLTEGTVNALAVPKVSAVNAQIFKYGTLSNTFGTPFAPLFRFPLQSSAAQTSYEDWQTAWQDIKARSI
jgi:spermidine/putrescine transport system substrate-binding protein